MSEISSDKILQFLNIITEGCKRRTKRVRFAHLSSFFNFLKNNLEPNFKNPCDMPMLRKLFRPKVTTNWNIIEKETVDEIIFRHANLSTTQLYLGKISETEAIRWIENLYA
jgi:integrase